MAICSGVGWRGSGRLGVPGGVMSGRGSKQDMPCNWALRCSAAQREKPGIVK